jgi:hypothetical protein
MRELRDAYFTCHAAGPGHVVEMRLAAESILPKRRFSPLDRLDRLDDLKIREHYRQRRTEFRLDNQTTKHDGANTYLATGGRDLVFTALC